MTSRPIFTVSDVVLYEQIEMEQPESRRRLDNVCAVAVSAIVTAALVWLMMGV